MTTVRRWACARYKWEDLSTLLDTLSATGWYVREILPISGRMNEYYDVIAWREEEVEVPPG